MLSLIKSPTPMGANIVATSLIVLTSTQDVHIFFFMRRRVLGFGDCCYHVVSRINERRCYLGEHQKAHFLDLLYASADFSGVEIITFCIMDDHFHLLIRVPLRKNISDKELLRRIKALYKPEEYDALEREYRLYKDAQNLELRHAFQQRFERRMYSLSEFVRTLKHRFSLWYNKTYDREGPLWTGKFTSVLVQSSADEYGKRALCAVASYIDLNAVRGRQVNHATDYPWCGVAQAVSGNITIQNGLKFILERSTKAAFTAKAAIKSYNALLTERTSSKIADLSTGWIIGKASFVDFVARRRPECFISGHFRITQEILALKGLGLHRIRRLRPVETPLVSKTRHT